MRLNTLLPRFRRAADPVTHESAPAVMLNDGQKLRRSVLSCLLWEETFYESGLEIGIRIADLARNVPAETVAALAVEARLKQNLRHAPLLLLVALVETARGTPLVADTIERVIQRPDEMTELIALYWRNGKRPLSAQMKKGLARAFGKFDAYQLAKYDRDGPIRLRDVLFLVHAKPKDEAQAAVWRKLAARELDSPDTWEVALSSGADKRETFERLLREQKLGYLALLRNLRTMMQAGCDLELVREAIIARRGAERVLPFRYVAAARAAVQLEPALDQALCEAVLEWPILPGRTIVLVDVSGSMDSPLSRRSDLRRIDAAATLASVIHGQKRVFTFSDKTVEVPPRIGMAGLDAIVASQPHAGTHLGAAVGEINRLPHDRLIIVTDEQSHDKVPDPKAQKAYMINVAAYQNGVGYGRWTHIDGFSEQVLRFIYDYETAEF